MTTTYSGLPLLPGTPGEAFDGADLRVGDLFSFGISHPCTAFEKWDVLYRVDQDYNVTEAIKTYF